MANDGAAAAQSAGTAGEPAAEKGWRARPFGLPARLYALVLIAVLPAVAFLALNEVEIRGDLTRRAEAEALRSARQVAGEIESLVENARALLVAVAQDPGVRERSDRTCQEFLAALGRESPHLAGFSVVDPEGYAVCVARPGRTGTSIADRPYFRRALAEGRFVVGERLTGRASGQAVLPFALRFEGAGAAPGGVVVSGLRLEWLRGELAAKGFPPDTSLTVFDRGGTVLVRLPDPEREGQPVAANVRWLVEAGQGGTLRAAAAETRDGVARIVAYVPPAESPYGLGVAVGLPEAWALAGVERRTWRGATLVGLGALLALLATLTFSRALVLRPVMSLVGAAERLRAGDLAARANLPARGTELGRLGTAFDGMAAELERRERDLALERERFRLILDNLSEAVVAVFPGGPAPVRNRGWLRLYGFERFEDLPGPGFEDLLPLLDLHDGEDRPLAVDEYPLRRVRRGETFEGLELKVRRRDTGASWWASYNGSFLRDHDGAIALALLSIRDVTVRREADERQQVLLAELSHRVKNLLAVVQAVAAQTAAGATSVPAFLDAFGGRLRALAAAQDLLTATGWRGASLEGLAQAALATYYGSGDGGDRVALDLDLDGGDLRLSPAATQNLALALHELATNAAKHGALSAPAGRVALVARRDGPAGRLVLTWTETGGPPVPGPPATHGFGTTLLAKVIAHQHAGRVELDWRPEGLVCRLDLPLDRIEEEGTG